MIFSSYPFLLLFLPSVLALYALRVRGWVSSDAWRWLLVAASLLFYAAWEWRFVPLLLGSVAINHWIGARLAQHRRRGWLVLGIAANLALLGWFKYRLFFATLLPEPLGLTATALPATLEPLVLPLGISFFTFQQIAWLVDLWRREVALPRWGEYLFFVTFFPQLIAGPIVHARELLPQIRSRWPTFDIARCAAGLLLLCLGLAKKVLIADTLADPVDALFAQPAQAGGIAGEVPWLAGLGYGLQLYFDFSGYADMAIGMGLMLGLTLPHNFASPYKSVSLIDFWRRWHITLSNFLRDYLYVPLGGRRRRYRALLLTMLLGGLWHGAGWQFVLWGGLHGVALCVAHAWRRRALPRPTWLTAPLTLAFVMLAWVAFRAESLDAALTLYRALTMPWTETLLMGRATWSPLYAELLPLCALGLGIALLCPPSRWWSDWLRSTLATAAPARRQRGLLTCGLLCGGLLFMVLMRLYGQPSQAFLYFNF